MASIEGANAYFAQTLRAEEWNTLDAEKKSIAITEAASMISRLSFSSQPLPRALDNAIYEQALCLLTMPTQAKERAQNIASGLKSFTAGKQSESYQDADDVLVLTNGMIICPAAMSWIGQYLRQKGAAKSGRLLSGRDCIARY